GDRNAGPVGGGGATDRAGSGRAGSDDAPAQALAHFPDAGDGVRGRIQQSTERPVWGKAGRIPREGEVGAQPGDPERGGDRDGSGGAAGHTVHSGTAGRQRANAELLGASAADDSEGLMTSRIGSAATGKVLERI